MSSMLEQAIVDATALREAALKNAEASIIEKYASEIKNAVETLLEEEPSENTETIAEDLDIPPAFAEGEAVCPSHGDEVEVYTLSVDDIKNLGSQMDAEAPDPEEAASDEMLQALAEAVLDEEDEPLEEDAKPDFLDLDKDGDKEEPMKDAVKDKEKVGKELTDNVESQILREIEKEGGALGMKNLERFGKEGELKQVLSQMEKEGKIFMHKDGDIYTHEPK